VSVIITHQKLHITQLSRNTGLVMYEAITFAPLASQHMPESRILLPTELVETHFEKFHIV